MDDFPQAPPQAPTTSDPGTFAARASAFLQWFSDLAGYMTSAFAALTGRVDTMEAGDFSAPLTTTAGHIYVDAEAGQDSHIILRDEVGAPQAALVWDRAAGTLRVSKFDGAPVGAVLEFDGGAEVTIDGHKIWHAGNGGAGSGLDADSLDGQSGSYYLAAANLTGSISASRLPEVVTDVRRGAREYKSFSRGSAGSSDNYYSAPGRFLDGIRMTWSSTDGNASGFYQRTLQKRTKTGVWHTIGSSS